MRLDKELVLRQLVSTRQRGVNLIKKGKVTVNGKVCTTVAQPVEANDVLTLTEEDMKWVGRGALKLLAALKQWKPVIKNKVCIDIGASTGGFTQVLLEEGAKKVFAVDTGSGQMAELLKSDKRVISLENTNARDLTKQMITEEPEVCVMDVSFISVLKVLPAVLKLMKPGSEIVVLIKPQFESGREFLDKKGVVRNQKVREITVSAVQNDMEKMGVKPIGLIDSPVTGGDGNKEYLFYGIYNRQ